MKASDWFCRGGHRVTSPFGWRADPFGSGEQVFHAGIDISGKVGDPIETPTRGIVTHAKMYAGYGNLVAVQDPRGCRHLFTHLDKIQIEIGQMVIRGDGVGTKGKTGRATGPHLHYQINKPSGGINGSGYVGDPDKYIYVEDEAMDKLIIINTRFDDWAGWEMHRSTGAPVLTREHGAELIQKIEAGEVALDELIVVGGSEIEARATTVTYLSGKNRYLTAQAVIEHLTKIGVK